MANARLEGTFGRIVDIVRSSGDPSSCWLEILEASGFSQDSFLSSQPIVSDVASLSSQLQRVFEIEPIPSEVAFLWFGLFDFLKCGEELEGYYVSGWEGTNPEEGQEVYVPKGGYLASTVLNGVKSATKRIERAEGGKVTDEFRALDYAVMFGAAALLAKFAILALTVRLAVYVGFDSGDWALVGNRPNDANEIG
jgi:hypothetical protein